MATSAKYNRVFLEAQVLHAENDLIEDMIGRRAQVINLLEHAKLELDKVIFVVLKDVLLEAFLIFRVIADDIGEPLFRHLCKGVVIHTGDCRSSLESVVATNLAKMVTLTKCADHCLNTTVVTHSHLAFTLTDEVEVGLLVLVKLLVLDNYISMRDMQLGVDVTHNCRQKGITSLLGELG